MRRGLYTSKRGFRLTSWTLGSEVFWDMGGVYPVVWVKKS